jgi:hypothetical protein
MAKLFGFSIDDEKKPDSVVSPVPQTNEDGVDYYIQSGFYGQYVDIEGVYRTEYDLIKRYREMAFIQNVMLLLKMLSMKQLLVIFMILQLKLNYQM